MRVICTDRGQHAAVHFQNINLRGDEVVAERSREARGQWPAGSKASDGTSVADFAVVPVDEHRDDYDGRKRWRYACPRCPRDVPIPESKMRRIIESGVSSLDISLIP